MQESSRKCSVESSVSRFATTSSMVVCVLHIDHLYENLGAGLPAGTELEWKESGKPKSGILGV